MEMGKEHVDKGKSEEIIRREIEEARRRHPLLFDEDFKIICDLESDVDVIGRSALDSLHPIAPYIKDIVSRYPWLNDLEKINVLMSFVWGVRWGLMATFGYLCGSNAPICDDWRARGKQFFATILRDYVKAFETAAKIFDGVRARYGKELDKLDEESRRKLIIIERIIRSEPKRVREKLKGYGLWREEWDRLSIPFTGF